MSAAQREASAASSRAHIVAAQRKDARLRQHLHGPLRRLALHHHRLDQCAVVQFDETVLAPDHVARRWHRDWELHPHVVRLLGMLEGAITHREHVDVAADLPRPPGSRVAQIVPSDPGAAHAEQLDRLSGGLLGGVLERQAVVVRPAESIRQICHNITKCPQTIWPDFPKSLSEFRTTVGPSGPRRWS